MSNTIASQFIGNNLSGFSTLIARYSPEKLLCSSSISLGLKLDINYFTALVNSPPQIVLLAVDLYKSSSI
jgi:hypothetical protein